MVYFKVAKGKELDSYSDPCIYLFKNLQKITAVLQMNCFVWDCKLQAKMVTNLKQKSELMISKIKDEN